MDKRASLEQSQGRPRRSLVAQGLARTRVRWAVPWRPSPGGLGRGGAGLGPAGGAPGALIAGAGQLVGRDDKHRVRTSRVRRYVRHDRSGKAAGEVEHPVRSAIAQLVAAGECCGLSTHAPTSQIRPESLVVSHIATTFVGKQRFEKLRCTEPPGLSTRPTSRSRPRGSVK